jgi:mannose-6-phosphate isomerase-like protein (cupin superfamily)
VKGFVDDIEELTERNKTFRHVVYTGHHLQLVVMSLKKGAEIGEEIHVDHDQFFRVEKGKGVVVIDGAKHKVRSGDAVVVPAGVRHNVINTGKKPLKLYTIYGPPDHPDGLTQKKKPDGPPSDEPFDGTTTE